MKINAFDTKSTAAAAAQAAQADARAARPAAGAADLGEVEPSAKVQLSSAAQLRDENREPSFDQAKVERIKAQIAAGQFKPDAGAIADKLIANAQELANRPAY